MFKCQKCNKNTEPREKQHKIPVLYRDKVYQHEHMKKNGKTYITTSYGKEIIKEIDVCEECFSKHEDENF